LRTRSAGLFRFLPLLARRRFDDIVRQAGYPGSRMVPALSALLSRLALKLLDKERHRHSDDFNGDEALGLFAGLHGLATKSFAADYSYRTQRRQQQQLLTGWVKALAPLLFPTGRAFALDFPTIPDRGDPSGLDNHSLPKRGKAGPRIRSFFAQEQESRVLCSANANRTRDDQDGEAIRFADFWKAVTDDEPAWLYFDSRLISYVELARRNQRGIHFVTIRRRGRSVLRRRKALPADRWTKAVIDIPKRRHQKITYFAATIARKGYVGSIRQIAVRGLGREELTLFLANGFDETPRPLIIAYAPRNRLEDGLGISVNFFHLDCLASEVRRNVDVAVALTVVAKGCYRWLAQQRNGFDKAAPKQR
jgi:hypothetical protein